MLVSLQPSAVMQVCVSGSIQVECGMVGMVKARDRCFAVTLERVGGDEGGHRQLMARCNSETESESKKEESTDNKVALAGINLPHTAGLSWPAGL